MVVRRSDLVVFGLALAFYTVTAFPSSPFDEQVVQAMAFLRGHVQIHCAPWIEHAQVGSYSYALHPPLPAFLLVPLVAIWGENQLLQLVLSIFLGALNVALAWTLLSRADFQSRVWLTVFLIAGNILWYESIIGTTWSLPMVTCVTFELLTLIELFGEARPVYVGIYAALAALGRYELALVMPIYALLLWKKNRNPFWMAPAFALAGVIFIWYNEVRFGSFFDQGLYFIPNVTVEPKFGFRYLPFNLYTLLFLAPVHDGVFPYIHPTYLGQAITLTSPAFVLALRPKFNLLVSMMGLAALLVSIDMLLCYANGFGQFGTRHYIPAFPFLLVMMAQGPVDRIAKVLICISIAFVGLGILTIHYFGLAPP